MRAHSTPLALLTLLTFGLAGCGGADAGAPAASVPASPAASTPASPTPSAATTNEEKDKVFVADVRAKVASGDYTPTKGSTEKAQKNIKTYMAALEDSRLAAAGEYNCRIKKDLAKQGVKDFSRRDFEKLMLKNSKLEEGFAPVLGLTWDESLKTICPE